MWRVPPGTVASGLPYTIPANSAVSISGTQQETRPLTANSTWVADPTATITYQWQRGANTNSLSNISGATSQTYTLTGSDVGNIVRVRVSATNHMGPTVATADTGTIGARFSAEGGSKTTADGYTYHTFTSSDYFWVEDPAPATYLEIWMVGGGAGGTARYNDKPDSNVMGGGGGGGGLFLFGYTISTGSLYFEIGGGGGNRSNGNVTRAYRVGSPWQELNWVPTSGGRGQTFQLENAGGSQWALGGSGGSGTRDGGGGGGGGGYWYYGYGGNGAGGGSNGGTGGTGHTLPRTDNFSSGRQVSGGGGGGGRNLAGSGQFGGGTGGGSWYFAVSGAANTGGGGGGGSAYIDGRNGNGGSGIVVLRYVTP